MHPLSVTWMWLPSQELYLHRVLTCFVCLRLLSLRGFRHLLAVVSPYKPQTRGPVRAHPRTYEFTMDPWIEIPHLLHSQAMSFTHVHTQASNVSTLRQRLGVTVLLSLKVTQVTPGIDQAPPLPLRGRPNL
jgi:hypothetical protein